MPNFMLVNKSAQSSPLEPGLYEEWIALLEISINEDSFNQLVIPKRLRRQVISANHAFSIE